MKKSLLGAVGDCHLDIVEGGHGRRFDVLVPPKNVAGPELARRDLKAYADGVSGKKTLLRTDQLALCFAVSATARGKVRGGWLSIEPGHLAIADNLELVVPRNIASATNGYILVPRKEKSRVV